MKDALILLAVGLVAILSYRQWQQWSTPAPIPSPTPAPVVVATPRPTPPPPEKHLTPEGMFAILDYVSTRTKSGIVGFEPGQMVKFVSANADKGTLLVTDGAYSVEVRPEQLTNDLDVANIAKRRDQAGQQQLHAIIAQAQDEDARIRMAADVDAAKNIGRRPSGAQIGSSSVLNNGSTKVGLWQRYPYGSPYYYLNR